MCLCNFGNILKLNILCRKGHKGSHYVIRDSLDHFRIYVIILGDISSILRDDNIVLKDGSNILGDKCNVLFLLNSLNDPFLGDYTLQINCLCVT